MIERASRCGGGQNRRSKAPRPELWSRNLKTKSRFLSSCGGEMPSGANLPWCASGCGPRRLLDHLHFEASPERREQITVIRAAGQRSAQTFLQQLSKETTSGPEFRSRHVCCCYPGRRPAVVEGLLCSRPVGLTGGVPASWSTVPTC